MSGNEKVVLALLRARPGPAGDASSTGGRRWEEEVDANGVSAVHIAARLGHEEVLREGALAMLPLAFHWPSTGLPLAFH